MFYLNLHYKDGVITSEACFTQISLSIEDFDVICDVPYNGPLYTFESLNVVKDFYFLFSFQSLPTDQSTSHKFPLTVGFVTLLICLIHYVKACVIISRKFNLGKL